MYLHNSAQVLIVLVKHLDDVLSEAFHSRVFVVVSVVTRKIFGVRISTRAWTNTWSVSHTRFETRLSHFLFPYCRIHCNTKMCQFLYSLTFFSIQYDDALRSIARIVLGFLSENAFKEKAKRMQENYARTWRWNTSLKNWLSSPLGENTKIMSFCFPKEFKIPPLVSDSPSPPPYSIDPYSQYIIATVRP